MDRPADRQALSRERRPLDVYLLELAGEDDAFARREAQSAATGVARLAPGLASARGIDSRRLRTLAYTHRASELIGTCECEVDSARLLLELAGIEREGSVRVRARRVRGTDVDTQRVERELGSVLVERGFSVDLDDPDHELRAVFSEDTCALGWLAAASRRDFAARAPTEKPFFQPGSMDPLLARAIANAAGAGPEATILDPMCGTGGVLVEAGLAGARVVGADAQWKMTHGARENLTHYGLEFDLFRGDATRIPLREGSVDGVVFDAPYGRQSKIEGELKPLVEGALSEARRIAPRAVVVADRPWSDAVEAAGWTIEDRFERRVHGSLTRYISVLG